MDAVNSFYTVIPHNFGLDKPEILDDTDDVQVISELLANYNMYINLFRNFDLAVAQYILFYL